MHAVVTVSVTESSSLLLKTLNYSPHLPQIFHHIYRILAMMSTFYGKVWREGYVSIRRLMRQTTRDIVN